MGTRTNGHAFGHAWVLLIGGADHVQAVLDHRFLALKAKDLDRHSGGARRNWVRFHTDRCAALGHEKGEDTETRAEINPILPLNVAKHLQTWQVQMA